MNSLIKKIVTTQHLQIQPTLRSGNGVAAATIRFFKKRISPAGLNFPGVFVKNVGQKGTGEWLQKINSIINLTALLLLTIPMQIAASSSNMTHRVMGTSTLLYKMMDYSKHQICFETAPIFSSMYDIPHINSNIILNGKSSLVFDQQGNGDLNPTWLNLMSNNTSADYYSTVTFTPSMTQSGALFHWYDQLDNDMFFDIKTALVQCKSEVAITEVGGGNGLNSGILNAQQAFTQSDWNYGKIGQANHVVGLDNIELRVGRAINCNSESSSYDILIAAFGLFEIPTGSGTKAEWLFEPQVGTNHWGVGFGFEALISGDDDLKFMIAGNYRYLTPAWETRSFDLLDNGQWSRYLLVQDTYGLPTAPTTLGYPGINYFTQQAYINGRSEFNLYTRLQKQFKSCYFEVAYNFFCMQRETIGAIKSVPSGYGIYALTGPAGGAGGVTTSSTATINQDVTTFDTLGSPISVTNDNFDKLSAAASAYATNTVTARLEIHNNNIIYGFGASIESALSTSAISTWSVWGQFGFVFDNFISDNDTSCDLLSSYDFDYTDHTTNQTDNINNTNISEEISIDKPIETLPILTPIISYHDAHSLDLSDINDVNLDDNSVDNIEPILYKNDSPTINIDDMISQEVQDEQNEDISTHEDDAGTIEIPWSMITDYAQPMPIETVEIGTIPTDVTTEENSEQNIPDNVEIIEQNQNDVTNTNEEQNIEEVERDNEKDGLFVHDESINNEMGSTQLDNQGTDLEKDLIDIPADQVTELPADTTIAISDEELHDAPTNAIVLDSDQLNNLDSTK